ncbi:DUF554 domain-containing protein [Ammoniphilus resinae]|uniref:Membrane protein YqgA involved in biofilm formation n=1 Tax=Ammoniphilus resinae TaxID=861532 RepID=A0ABS4GQ21_9BACL|nr:DUF554 domain-containing protein [Ammoniphilus resinae]MBP1932326.1 putative membrane protein YqgA involved in biofilm formation [Ammoniphilus resinae]
MVLWGTIINTMAIICGALLGSRLTKISEGVKNTIMQGIGMAVCILGIMMALKTEQFIIVLASLVVGGILGEWMRIDKGLDKIGKWVESRFGQKGNKNLATGFVTATLVYCIGAMTILGALDSGLRGNHDILYTKSILDGFTSIIFASTLGIGVIFSAIPVFLYQGLIALGATFITLFVSDQLLNAIIVEVTAVGGILIVGIGLNILEVKKINVANLLPSLLVAAFAVWLLSKLSIL